MIWTVLAVLCAVLGGVLFLWRGRPMLFATLLLLGAGAWLLLWGLVQNRLVHGTLLGLALAALAGALVLEGVVLANSRSHLPEREPDAVVILGAAVWANGPSPMMQVRVNTALEYLNAHPDVPVVVSGGQGSREPESEAQAMYNCLVAAGIAPERILLEDASTNTVENLKNSAAVLEAAGISCQRLLVVSNGFHLARVRLLAGRMGLEVYTLSAPSPDFNSRVYFYARETMGLVKSFLFDHPDALT